MLPDIVWRGEVSTKEIVGQNTRLIRGRLYNDDLSGTRNITLIAEYNLLVRRAIHW